MGDNSDRKAKLENEIVKLVVDSLADPTKGNVTVLGVIDTLEDTIKQLKYVALMKPAKKFYE